MFFLQTMKVVSFEKSESRKRQKVGSGATNREKGVPYAGHIHRIWHHQKADNQTQDVLLKL